MSSPLYAVTVRDVRGDTARLDVVSVCEAGCFTLSRLFAVSLLCEPFWMPVYTRPGVVWRAPIDGPLKGRFTEAELIDWAGSGVPGAEEARLAVVRDVAYGHLRNVPFLGASPDPDGLYRVGFRHAQGERFRLASKAYSSALDQVYATRTSLSGMPAATLAIQVSDPRCVAHLAPGMLWDSYAFDDEGAVLL